MVYTSLYLGLVTSYIDFVLDYPMSMFIILCFRLYDGYDSVYPRQEVKYPMTSLVVIPTSTHVPIAPRRKHHFSGKLSMKSHMVILLERIFRCSRSGHGEEWVNIYITEVVQGS